MEDGKENLDYNRIWQNTHYTIIESARRHLAGKSSKGLIAFVVLCLPET